MNPTPRRTGRESRRGRRAVLGAGRGAFVRAWGCNGPVGEGVLALDRAARVQIQRGLRTQGFEPGGANGRFGPRTRAAIRAWQTSRGTRATGYLDGPAAEALRRAGSPPTATAEQETVFWQSITSSTNPAEFAAYLAQFPRGVFRALAQARLAALRSPRRHYGRCTSTAARGVPGLRRVPGDGSDAGRPIGAGPLRGDGRGVPGFRVGDRRRNARRVPHVR